MNPWNVLGVFERLIAYFKSEPGPLATECWVWQKSCCNKGYGHLRIYDPDIKKSRTHRAHIISWAMAEGRLPFEGMTLDHRCCNTKCIRPSHLKEMPRPENTARGNRTRHGHVA